MRDSKRRMATGRLKLRFGARTVASLPWTGQQAVMWTRLKKIILLRAAADDVGDVA